jgi:hypothetical protein
MEPPKLGFVNFDDESHKAAKIIALLSALIGSAVKIIPLFKKKEKPPKEKTVEERLQEVESILKTWIDTLPNIKDDVTEGKEDNKYMIKQIAQLIGLLASLRSDFNSEISNMRREQLQTRSTVDQLLIVSIQNGNQINNRIKIDNQGNIDPTSG